ncbi:hypothetical protein [Streptomyces sp. NPDC053048]|uniref:hypothetical protein n=1 Tax=Streptomyces sp. NPDC053048 TaxID=3365694 RepID=UPI0037D4C66A
MSHQQPGPYGQPPLPQQQPNPYGQAGAPAYGYPAQAGPYGVPQQPGPYGQQPGAYGQQPGAYGYPAAGHPAPHPAPYPPPIPPNGSGKGKAIGIALGAVIVVGAVVIGGFLFFAGGSSVPDDGKRYKLTAPDVAAGEYRKDPDARLPVLGSEAEADLRTMGVANAEPLSAAYQTSGSKLTGKQMRFMGAWGRIKKPEAVVDNMFTSMRVANAKKDATLELTGSPQAVSPSGLENAVMKCQKARAVSASTPTGKPLVMHLCVWADHSTTATVFSVDMGAAMGGREVSMDEAAALAARVRQDVRVEIPKK